MRGRSSRPPGLGGGEARLRFAERQVPGFEKAALLRPNNPTARSVAELAARHILGRPRLAGSRWSDMFWVSTVAALLRSCGTKSKKFEHRHISLGILITSAFGMSQGAHCAQVRRFDSSTRKQGVDLAGAAAPVLFLDTGIFERPKENVRRWRSDCARSSCFRRFRISIGGE